MSSTYPLTLAGNQTTPNSRPGILVPTSSSNNNQNNSPTSVCPLAPIPKISHCLAPFVSLNLARLTPKKDESTSRRYVIPQKPGREHEKRLGAKMVDNRGGLGCFEKAQVGDLPPTMALFALVICYRCWS